MIAAAGSAVYPIVMGTNLTRAVKELWWGFPIQHGPQLLYIGGILPMFDAVLLIFIAGAFQRVAELGGSIQTLTNLAFDRLSNRRWVTTAAFVLATSYPFLMGSQTLSILMTGNSIRPQFEKRRVSPKVVLQVIADSSELVSAVVPWNLLGLQAGVIIGIGAHQFIPYAWFIWVCLGLSVIRYNIPGAWTRTRRYPFRPVSQKSGESD